MQASPLTTLAEQLLVRSKALDKFNATNGFPPASFDHEGFVNLPSEVEQERKEVIDLAQDLKRLAQGPRDLLYELGNQFNDLANLQYVYHHRLPLHVPSERDISYAELAAATRTEERMLRRMLRMAMMNRVFVETEEGKIRHSAASRILHEETGGMDAMGFFLEEMFPSSTRMIESFAQYPSSGEPNQTAFNLAHNTSRPFYLELEAHSERAQRFGSGMRWLTRGGRYSDETLVRGYKWTQFDRPDGLIVDVGGGQGAVARALARATDSVKIVVQDLPVCASQGDAALPAELKSRISFMPHDFFEPQPIKGADVYFLRYILHNWSDAYAEKILKAIVPSLTHRSRIVIYEFLPANASELAWSDKQPYNMDMIQAIAWNSVERTKEDWEQLFRSVDARLKVTAAKRLSGSVCGLIEAMYEESVQTNGNGMHVVEEDKDAQKP